VESDYLRSYLSKGDLKISYGSDSFWALLLAETGTFGAIAFGVFVYQVMRLPRRQIRRRTSCPTLNTNSEYDHLLLVFRCLILLQVLQFALMASFLAPRFWFTLAIFFALKQRVRIDGARAIQTSSLQTQG
jgi:hypothetical protein